MAIRRDDGGSVLNIWICYTIFVLIQVFMHFLKRVLVKSTAAYNALPREGGGGGRKWAMPPRELQQLKNMAATRGCQGLGRLMTIRKILPSWDHWENVVLLSMDKSINIRTYVYVTEAFIKLLIIQLTQCWILLSHI